MFASIIALHAPLIRDYPGAPPTPPAPPAPPQPPQPPVAEPIAFSAVTRAGLFGIIGSAISSTTLATITCADAAMTIMQSEVVAGLAFSYSAGVLSVAGTPTGSTRVQRVVVSYIASDGSNSVRGSTSHEITLANASEVLTIGSQAGAAGRVGHPLSATLASPSANYNVNVTAHPAGLIPGCTAALNWTPGATSSGTLTLTGTPTRAGALPLVVNYRSGAIQIGASVHSVVIAPAYEAQPAAPAPTPAPAPPAPSAPPAPTPAPAPGVGPDPTLANTQVLMRFEVATRTEAETTGPVKTHSFAAAGLSSFAIPETIVGGDSIVIVSVTDNGTFDSGPITYLADQVTVSGVSVTIPGAFGINSPHTCEYRVSRAAVSAWADERGNTFAGGNVTATAGAVGSGGNFYGALTALSCSVAALDGIAAGVSVECMVDIGAEAWAALVAPGADVRFSPVASYTAPDGRLLWALGFVSKATYLRGIEISHFVYPQFWTAVDDALTTSWTMTQSVAAVRDRPAKFVHLAGGLKTYSTTSWERAAWLDGTPGAARQQTLAIAPTAQAAGVLKLGGACPAFKAPDSLHPLVTIVPFVGVIDELRIKAPGQYITNMTGGAPTAILPASRVIPWPNY